MDIDGKLVADLAVKANGQRIFTAPGEPPHVYYVLRPDGHLERTTAMPGRWEMDAADLNTLCRVAVDWTADGVRPEIWCDRDCVVADLNPSVSRGPVCALNLTYSPQMVRLMEWDRAGRVSLSQAELVLLLRTLFAGCFPPDFLPAVRNVRSSKNAEVNSQISQGKVSLGKSIVAEMTGVAAIPERVTFVVPVFAQLVVPVVGEVRVEIDPDPQSERFTLVVLPGDVERAFGKAEEDLVERVSRVLAGLMATESDIPVYRGSTNRGE